MQRIFFWAKPYQHVTFDLGYLVLLDLGASLIAYGRCWHILYPVVNCAFQRILCRRFQDLGVEGTLEEQWTLGVR